MISASPSHSSNRFDSTTTRGGHRGPAVADSNLLAAVLPQNQSTAEVVVVDPVPGRLAVNQPDDQGGPGARLALDPTMIDAVAAPIKSYSARVDVSIRTIATDHRAIGQPAMVGGRFRVATEGDQIVGMRDPLEPKAGDNETTSRDSKPRAS